MNRQTLVFLSFLFALGCGDTTAEEDDAAVFQVFLEEGNVTVVSTHQAFECRYRSPSACKVETEESFVVQTRSHVEQVYSIGSLKALAEYNDVDAPNADSCDLPVGSLYLATFLYPTEEEASSESEPVIIDNSNASRPERGEFIRLKPEAIAQSAHAQSAYDFMMEAMLACEQRGAPNWRPE